MSEEYIACPKCKNDVFKLLPREENGYWNFQCTNCPTIIVGERGKYDKVRILEN